MNTPATDLKTEILTLAKTARLAAAQLAIAPTAVKNAALSDFADLLHNRQDDILKANQRDLAQATKLNNALRDRLLINKARLAATIEGVKQIIGQEDPIGQITDMHYMPSGIQVGKMRVPIGVILMIYESRPAVTADASALAIKSGNAIILRGGSEAHHSNTAIGKCLHDALAKHGLPGTAQVVAHTDRTAVGILLSCADNIDLVIPRGGKQLIERVMHDARMPILKHLDGNCHVYVDADADLDMALPVTINAKTRRFGVCNAAESLLVHADIAAAFLPDFAKAMHASGVEIRACELSLPHLADATPACEDDFYCEYLAPIISVKTVATTSDAIAHICHYGSHHTDAIVTRNINTARRFLREVDSSSVIVNASTSFADGGEYGLGSEIGISTDKLHARGPVGAKALTTEKFIVWGGGHCRT